MAGVALNFGDFNAMWNSFHQQKRTPYSVYVSQHAFQASSPHKKSACVSLCIMHIRVYWRVRFQKVLFSVLLIITFLNVLVHFTCSKGRGREGHRIPNVFRTAKQSPQAVRLPNCTSGPAPSQVPGIHSNFPHVI